jgi:hypothetical protein
MTKSRVLSAGLMASALLIAPMSSALAGGTQWSHRNSYHAPVYHGGYRGAYYRGGGGYWRGGVWWPAAAAAAVVGTAAAIVAAPFVAIGNAVASSAYVPPPNPAPYYAPQQYYPSQGYNAPRQYYAPAYGSAPQYDRSVPPDYYAQPGSPQYYNNGQLAPAYAQPQRYYAPPATYDAPAYYPPGSNNYYRQRGAAPAPDADYYDYAR